jgi:hypothetical protein
MQTLKLRHYVTALTESGFLYVFQCKNKFLLNPDCCMAQKFGCGVGWKGIDGIQKRFCKQVLKMPRFATNCVAELKLGTDNSRGKILCLVVKYWLTIMQMEKDELVKMLP